MKAGRVGGEVKGLVFQAADESEFHEWLKAEVAFLWDFPSHKKKSRSHGKKIPSQSHLWLKVVGSSASGNPRVFGKAETGKLSHVTMNLTVNDHIIGRL